MGVARPQANPLAADRGANGHPMVSPDARRALLMIALAALVGLTILTAVVWHGTQPLTVDRVLARAAGTSSWTAGRHQRFAQLAVGLGNRWPLAVACAAALLTAWTRRNVRHALLAPFATMTAVGATSMLKPLVDRRFAWDLTGGRFPSGHAAGVAALAAATALVWAAPGARGVQRWAVLAAAAGIVVVVGWALVVTRAHSPIDVAAGWLVGVAVATGLGYISEALSRESASTNPRRPERAPGLPDDGASY